MQLCRYIIYDVFSFAWRAFQNNQGTPLYITLNEIERLLKRFNAFNSPNIVSAKPSDNATIFVYRHYSYIDMHDATAVS